MENKFDTQFLIEGHDLDEDAIHDGILNSAKGDCLLVVGDEDVVKVHTTLTPRGRCWNTPPPRATSTPSSSKTWNVSPTACTANIV